MIAPITLSLRRWPLVLLALLMPLATPAAEGEAERGKFSGAKITEYPAWFKESFLNLQDDVAEAKAAGKRLLIFFEQDGCPYCNAMVERNLTQKNILDKVRRNFDVIAINMWGDRDITNVDGSKFIEKTFAEHLKVQFTPTLVFYDENGSIILRLNGYRAPDRFIHDLEYVAGRKEKDISYRDYIQANYVPGKSSKQMHAEDFFAVGKIDLAAQLRKGRPLAVFFEQKDCPACDTLHGNVLPDPQTREILKRFHAVQLDMWAKTPLLTPAGKKTTAREWAKELDIRFAPSIVLFNDRGEEIIRSEAFFKVFHTQGILTYVLDGAYKQQPSFQRYLSDKADRLREQGQSVDIWNFAGEGDSDAAK